MASLIVCLNHHTFPYFDNFVNEIFRKTLGGKEKNAVNQNFIGILSFPTMLATLNKTIFKFSVVFILKCANILGWTSI